MRATFFLSALAATASLVGASPMNQKRATDTQFQIYAYGDNIGGLPVFTTGGAAYIGNPNDMASTQAASVIFTHSSDGHLKGRPNMTSADGSPSWSNLTFYVPTSSASSHTVGFQNSTSGSSSRSVASFSFYGTWIGVTGSGGALETLWYAVATDTDGVYALNWNSTSDGSDGQTMLTLKATPPSDD